MNRSSKTTVPYQPTVLIILIAGAITIFFLIAIGREFFQTRSVGHQLNRLRKEVAAEEQRQSELKNLLTYLSSPTFQERQARLQLGLQAEGEKVLILPAGEEESQSGTTEQSNASAEALSNPTKWWDYFFKPR